MQDWERIREQFPKTPRPTWQWATSGSKCVVCDIHGYETAQGYLVYVEGEGDKQYCKMCYYSKFIEGEITEEDLEVADVFHVDDLPPEVMTDGKGNTTFDNW